MMIIESNVLIDYNSMNLSNLYNGSSYFLGKLNNKKRKSLRFPIRVMQTKPCFQNQITKNNKKNFSVIQINCMQRNIVFKKRNNFC